MPERKFPRILFIGPMLGSHPGWVPNPMEILVPYLRQMGYTCQLSSAVLNRYLRLMDIIRTIFANRKNVDILCIQVYSGRSFYVTDAASLFGRILRIPVTMVLHGGDLPRFLSQNPAWGKKVFSRAEQIIAPSGYLEKQVSAMGFHARIIPNILKLEKYPYRNRRNLSPTILWMRTFYDYYQPEMALEVLSRVMRDYPEAKLTMAGQDRGLQSSTQLQAGRLGLSNQVTFPGFLNTEGKKIAFANHDIFLNTTRIDNMPVCLLEAGCAGIPIVSTNVGGIPDLVKDETSALLVGPDDIQGMANAVMRLLAQPDLAEKLSQEGRKLAEKSDIRNVLPLWDEAFQSI